MKHRKGITQTDAVVTILIIIAVIVTLMAVLPAMRKPPSRLSCGTNLKGLGNALQVYAFDYKDKFSVQGAGIQTWASTTTEWDNPAKDWTDPKGTMTIASSLYLLIREADVGPKSLICKPYPSQKKPKFKVLEKPFKNKTSHDIVDLWDFGPDPKKHVSYAYQFPYGKYPPDGTGNPANAIMADRNPWTDPHLTHSDIKKETVKTFIDKITLINFSSATQFHTQIGNSAAHDREGQNVLFADNHVKFVKRPDCGSGNDNIYTIGGDTESQRRTGTPPTAKKIDTANPEDSLLMNDK